MDKHKCRLCGRRFPNGRALGGHMKGHLATRPLPPKTSHQHRLGDPIESASSSDAEQELQGQNFRREAVVVVEEKSLVYGLRENPKKSSRFADPEFSFAVDSAGAVVQDREIETESRNLSWRRSKRNRKVGTSTTTDDMIKKPKLMRKPSLVESPTEPETVSSSVSDTSPEEDVAICLIMLSRDVWKNKNVEAESEEIELNDNKKIHGKHHRCGKCQKVCRSYVTLDENKRVCSETKKTVKASAIVVAAANDSKIFKCPFCFRVFESGQALGGHKRSHLLAVAANSTKFDNNLIDLNLPVSSEDDEFGGVSDA